MTFNSRGDFKQVKKNWEQANEVYEGVAESKTTSRSNYPKKWNERYNGQPTNIKQTITKPENPYARTQSSKKCYSCGQTSHFSNECSERKKIALVEEGSEQENYNSEHEEKNLEEGDDNESVICVL